MGLEISDAKLSNAPQYLTALLAANVEGRPDSDIDHGSRLAKSLGFFDDVTWPSDSPEQLKKKKKNKKKKLRNKLRKSNSLDSGLSSLGSPSGGDDDPNEDDSDDNDDDFDDEEDSKSSDDDSEEDLDLDLTGGGGRARKSTAVSLVGTVSVAGSDNGQEHEEEEAVQLTAKSIGDMHINDD